MVETTLATCPRLSVCNATDIDKPLDC